jgi:mycofactocin precursor
VVPFRLLSIYFLALGATNAREVTMNEQEPETEVLSDDELLVEEVSIDGMCGVY